QSAFRELEPYEVKVSRTVLRGQGRSNPPALPDTDDKTQHMDILWIHYGYFNKIPLSLYG
ncbi:hypothetical protein, partial [Perlabentimonas gracilis]